MFYGAETATGDEVFCKKGALKNLTNFTGKHMCCSLFVTKLQAFSPATLLKRDFNTGDFLLNFRNFKENLF